MAGWCGQLGRRAFQRYTPQPLTLVFITQSNINKRVAARLMRHHHLTACCFTKQVKIKQKIITNLFPRHQPSLWVPTQRKRASNSTIIPDCVILLLFGYFLPFGIDRQIIEMSGGGWGSLCPAVDSKTDEDDEDDFPPNNTFNTRLIAER